MSQSDPVTVIHYIGSASCVKTCTFTAPHIAKSVGEHAAAITLRNHPDGPEIGWAGFSGGIVVLSGAALEQYKPLTQPDRVPTQKENTPDGQS